jgi:hypothetical protein
MDNVKIVGAAISKNVNLYEYFNPPRFILDKGDLKKMFLEAIADQNSETQFNDHLGELEKKYIRMYKQNHSDTQLSFIEFKNKYKTIS